MSSIFAGLGGSFPGRYDTELQAKIDAALAGKASSKDKIDDFVKQELKIDPATLPLTPKQALTKINEMLGARSKGSVLFEGNSLGIKNLRFYDQPQSDPPCDQCGTTDTSVHSGSTYVCYECPEDANGDYYRFTYIPSENGEVVLPTDKDKNWDELMRAYKAIIKNQDNLYSFKVAYVYYGEPEGPEFIVQTVEPDPKWYGTGMTLRLERHVIGQDNEYVYAKVGGLFSDTDVCVLPSLTPITDLSSWRVVEVL